MSPVSLCFLALLDTFFDALKSNEIGTKTALIFKNQKSIQKKKNYRYEFKMSAFVITGNVNFMFWSHSENKFGPAHEFEGVGSFSDFEGMLC